MTLVRRRIGSGAVITLSWDYAYLIGFTQEHPHLFLLCGFEPGIASFKARCDPEHGPLLRPYSELYRDRLADPARVEAPLVPVTRAASGDWLFSPAGARYDHPAPPPDSA